MTPDDYFDSPAYGSTAIRIAATQSVAHYLAGKEKETVSMTKGTGNHAAILEPEAIGSRIIVAPKCRCTARTKKGSQCTNQSVPGSDKCGIHGGNDEAEEWLNGLDPSVVVVPEDVMDEARECAEAVHMQLERFGLGELPKLWRTEVPFFATARLTDEPPGYVIEPEGGPIQVRSKLDLIAGEPIAVAGDVKMMGRGIEPWNAARTIRHDGYYIQAALYLDIIEAVTGVKVPAWLWICHEANKPWGVRVYEATEEDLDLGRKMVGIGLRRLTIYEETGDAWADWPNEIEPLYLPRYEDD